METNKTLMDVKKLVSAYINFYKYLKDNATVETLDNYLLKIELKDGSSMTIPIDSSDDYYELADTVDKILDWLRHIEKMETPKKKKIKVTKAEIQRQYLGTDKHQFNGGPNLVDKLYTKLKEENGAV